MSGCVLPFLGSGSTCLSGFTGSVGAQDRGLLRVSSRERFDCRGARARGGTGATTTLQTFPPADSHFEYFHPAAANNQQVHTTRCAPHLLLWDHQPHHKLPLLARFTLRIRTDSCTSTCARRRPAAASYDLTLRPSSLTQSSSSALLAQRFA